MHFTLSLYFLLLSIFFICAENSKKHIWFPVDPSYIEPCLTELNKLAFWKNLSQILMSESKKIFNLWWLFYFAYVIFDKLSTYLFPFATLINFILPQTGPHFLQQHHRLLQIHQNNLNQRIFSFYCFYHLAHVDFFINRLNLNYFRVAFIFAITVEKLRDILGFIRIANLDFSRSTRVLTLIASRSYFCCTIM